MSIIAEDDHIETTEDAYRRAAAEFEYVRSTMGFEGELQHIVRNHDGELATVVYLERVLIDAVISMRLEHICGSSQKLRCIVMITATERHAKSVEDHIETVATVLSGFKMFLYDYCNTKPLYDKTGIYYYKYGKVVV